ncbi:DNA topoisomerase-3 [Lachnospiraceae bacterium PF1-22]
MKLCICEKPDLARNVAAAIRLMGETVTSKREEGNITTYHSDNYIVVPLHGHVYELLYPDEYRPNYNSNEKYPWKVEELPFRPTPFRFKVKQSEINYCKVASKYLKDPSVTELVHCGDADREGEIIVRIVVQMAGCKKPMKRMWVNTQEPPVIKDALLNAKNDSEYNNLASAGYTRQYMDWAIGMNYTRLMSVLAGQTFHVGRVKGAIIRAIYDRDMQIKNFVPKKFFEVQSKQEDNGTSLILTSKKTFDEDMQTAAHELAEDYNTWGGEVTKIESKQIAAGRPKLFSQTTLQNIMSFRYQMDPQDTLKACQSLYDNKYLTYPRTASEYLATAEIGRVKKTITSMNGNGYPDLIFRNVKSIFDDSKMDEESHSAITPTTQIPSNQDIAKFTSNEKLVYETITHRFAAVFCKEDCLVDTIKATIEIGDKDSGGEEFKLEGRQIASPGWTKYDNTQKKDKFLPPLTKGQRISPAFAPVERETSPPKHYSVTTLNNFLLNPFRTDEDSGDEDYEALKQGLQIGTVATRASILAECVSKQYINLKKTTYTITESGIALCENAMTLGIDLSKEQTVTFQKFISSVLKGEETTKNAVDYTFSVIDEVIANSKGKSLKSTSTGFGKVEVLGKCPKCGGDVLNRKTIYPCSNDACDFALFPSMKHYKNKLSITPNRVKALLGKSGHASFELEKKDGDKYKAYLKLVINGKYVNFEHDGFPTKRK